MPSPEEDALRMGENVVEGKRRNETVRGSKKPKSTLGGAGGAIEETTAMKKGPCPTILKGGLNEVSEGAWQWLCCVEGELSSVPQ